MFLIRFPKALAPPTLVLLSTGLEELPHTVEDFFRLCLRFVQHCASSFLASVNVDLYNLLDTALRSLDLPTLTAAGSGGVGDTVTSDRTNTTSSGVGIDNDSTDNTAVAKAGTYASTAAARFLHEALLFTTEASEDQPSAVVSVSDPSGLPPASTEASLGARRMLFWLLKTTTTTIAPATGVDQSGVGCGGQRLTTACVHSCCLGLPDDRFPDVADLLYHLKMIMPREVV